MGEEVAVEAELDCGGEIACGVGEFGEGVCGWGVAAYGVGAVF